MTGTDPGKVTLLSGEMPPAGHDWLVIVKTIDEDFEVVLSLIRESSVRTLATSPVFEVALQHAFRTAAEINISTIYTFGTIV